MEQGYGGVVDLDMVPQERYLTVSLDTKAVHLLLTAKKLFPTPWDSQGAVGG